MGIGDPEEAHTEHGETKQITHTVALVGIDFFSYQWWDDTEWNSVNEELYSFVFYEPVFNLGGIYIEVELLGHKVTTFNIFNYV